MAVVRYSAFGAVAAALFLVACGEDSASTGDQSVSSKCIEVGSTAIKQIHLREQPETAAAIETSVSSGPLSSSPSTPVYYVAVKTSSGVGVWALSDEAFKGESGSLVIATDSNAKSQAASEAVGVDPGTAVGPGNPDYEAVRDCLDV